MKEDTLKLKKGGLDTIIAYIVVMLPLFYVLIYMVATIYHFTVQMYMNQVVKEAVVMISTYGEATEQHENYIHSKLSGVLPTEEDDKANIKIEYYKREFVTEGQNAGTVAEAVGPTPNRPTLKKADIIGIYVESLEPSILGNVAAFSIFGEAGGDGSGLLYTSYREEIIRNERQH